MIEWGRSRVFFLCREVTLGTGKNRIGDTIRALNICTMNECMVFLLSVEKKICGKEANKKRAQFSDLSHPSHYRIIYFYERKHIKTKLQNSMPNCLGVCVCGGDVYSTTHTFMGHLDILVGTLLPRRLRQA